MRCSVEPSDVTTGPPAPKPSPLAPLPPPPNPPHRERGTRMKRSCLSPSSPGEGGGRGREKRAGVMRVLEEIRPSRPPLGEVHAGREVKGRLVAQEALRLVDADAGPGSEKTDHFRRERMDGQLARRGSLGPAAAR